MLFIAAFAATVASAPSEQAQARATVRIARPVKVSQEEWVRQPPSRRRERTVVEEGRRLKLHLIEME